MAQADSDDSTRMPGAEKPQDSLYFPTDVTPEQLFLAIGKLRMEARREVDRLLRFLDLTDDYVSRELEDNNDEEPSLGFPEAGHYGGTNTDDREAESEHDEDGGDNECSLGSLDQAEDQTKWGFSSRKDLEEQCDDEGVRQ